MNQKSYDRLPKDLQKILDQVTGPEAARRFGTHLDEREVDGRELMAKSGGKIINLRNSVISRIEAQTVHTTTGALTALEKKGSRANSFYLEMLDANASLRSR